MKAKTYYYASGAIFLIVGLIHLLRIIFNWDVVVGSVSISIWVSVLVVLLLCFMCYSAFKLIRGEQPQQQGEQPQQPQNV